MSDYSTFPQRTLDALLRVALWELSQGGPGSDAFWAGKIQELLDAGARLRPEAETEAALYGNH